LTNSSDGLLRLKKQSLVDRRILNVRHRGRPRYEYSINARGRNRLKFYGLNQKESL
jgi:DNA-binding PadR family transcriptional regulator